MPGYHKQGLGSGDFLKGLYRDCFRDPYLHTAYPIAASDSVSQAFSTLGGRDKVCMVVLGEVRTRIVSRGFEVRAYKLGQLLTLRFSPVRRAFEDPSGLWCASCFFSDSGMLGDSGFRFSGVDSGLGACSIERVLGGPFVWQLAQEKPASFGARPALNVSGLLLRNLS